MVSQCDILWIDISDPAAEQKIIKTVSKHIYLSHVIMLEKKPKSNFKRLLGITAASVFVVEAVGIAVSYGLWYKLNTERGTYVHQFIFICFFTQ